MADAPLHISAGDVSADTDDRFHRFRLIRWWDQARLASSRVLLIGAGALGNEIAKNLALLGFGHLLIADLDRIENSNLSRSVLYRESDNGKFKSEVAARAAKDIYPAMRVHHFVGNVVHDLGLGAFRWADVVIGGLDNREARLAINRNCWRVGKPWIDGAIEQIQGIARVFVPASDDAPCYECTMSEADWKLLQMRRSCNLLTRQQMTEGRTPTTPTVSSIIAGVQCQEAVKLLHGLPTLAGKGWVFDGLGTEAYQIEYQRKPDCYSHDRLDEIITLPAKAADITGRELLDEAKRRLGPSTTLELARDVLEKLVCPNCRHEEVVYQSMGRISASAAACPACGAGRDAVTFYKLSPDLPMLDMTPAQFGTPPFDILIARGGGRSIGLELGGDAPDVIGAAYEPAGGQEDLEWQ